MPYRCKVFQIIWLTFTFFEVVINEKCIMWRCFISVDYFKVAEKALTDYNPKCVSNIRQATLMISDLLDSENGTRYVQSKFRYVGYWYIHNY